MGLTVDDSDVRRVRVLYEILVEIDVARGCLKRAARRVERGAEFSFEREIASSLRYILDAHRELVRQEYILWIDKLTKEEK